MRLQISLFSTLGNPTITRELRSAIFARQTWMETTQPSRSRRHHDSSAPHKNCRTDSQQISAPFRSSVAAPTKSALKFALPPRPRPTPRTPLDLSKVVDEMHRDLPPPLSNSSTFLIDNRRKRPPEDDPPPRRSAWDHEAIASDAMDQSEFEELDGFSQVPNAIGTPRFAKRPRLDSARERRATDLLLSPPLVPIPPFRRPITDNIDSDSPSILPLSPIPPNFSRLPPTADRQTALVLSHRSQSLIFSPEAWLPTKVHWKGQLLSRILLHPYPVF